MGVPTGALGTRRFVGFIGLVRDPHGLIKKSYAYVIYPVSIFI